MPPKKQPYSRRLAPKPLAAAPSADPSLKTTGVTAADVIRVLSKVGTGIFRDGMTVGEFLRAVPSRDAGLRMLASCRRSGVIGFEQGSVENEIDAARAEAPR